MLQTKENTCRIEGVLSEIDLKTGSFNKNGSQMNSIGGTIKVRVNQKINDVDTELEIPVYMFAAQYTNAGQKNPAYESIERIMNEYVSIAASNYDQADRVSIDKAQLKMNEYYGQNGQLVSFPRVHASFVKKIKAADCKPAAEFSIVFMVGSKGYEVDKDGVETSRYLMKGIVPQYGGTVDVFPFVAVNRGVIDAISNYWNVGDTVKAIGKLNFSSKTEVHTVEVDFGEPREEVRTITVSELILTGGNATPLDGDFALNSDEVDKALADRKARLEEAKAKSADKNANKGASGKAPAKGKFSDLGF